ncbi:MAG: hypothetical protein J6P80_04080 [Kiritimatiellae bacterium]|nr:hypothetical protein [Kiritimatiellia bacterium]
MVRDGDYVALRTRMRDGDAAVRLYNVVEDPFEAHDLAALPEHRERLERMTAELDRRLKR